MPRNLGELKPLHVLRMPPGVGRRDRSESRPGTVIGSAVETERRGTKCTIGRWYLERRKRSERDGGLSSLSVLIVPKKRGNRTAGTLQREGERLVKEPRLGNTEDTLMSRIEVEEHVSTQQQRIARNARNLPEVSFTALSHHIDVKWLWIAEQRVRKDGATGVDGVTSAEYRKEMGKRLRELESRMKSGSYRAPPVRRVYVPKGRTEKRPIGIPTYEDKIAQKAIQMVLEPIYEQQFYDFSYGFRPGKSQHMALDRVWHEVMNMRGAYVIDLDISKYFDTIDHRLLREV